MVGGGTVVLTPEQIFGNAWTAGFPPDVATIMTAIAMKESSGDTQATNIRAAHTSSASDPGEESYGLWQINVGPNGNKTLPAQMGIQKTDLYDPATNARAAYLLWSGSSNGLRNWSTYNNGAYLSSMPTAQLAMANVMTLDGEGQVTADVAPVGADPSSLYMGIGVGLAVLAVVILTGD